MKIWRKNRTQFAQLFIVDGSTIFGFLVGEVNGVKQIETLKGKHISLSGGNSMIKNEDNENKTGHWTDGMEATFVETRSKTESGNTVIKREYKSGKVEHRYIQSGY